MQLGLAASICPHLLRSALVRTCAAFGRSAAFLIPPQLHRRTIGGHYHAAYRAVAPGAEQWSIYDDPVLYDHIFEGREYAEEVDFLYKAFQKHANVTGRQQKPDVFLEMGCGPARHTIEAARQGAGRGVGVDNNTAMLRYAKQLAAEAGAEVELLQGSFGSLADSLHLGSQVHLAFFPFGTLSHALTNDDALAWLRDTAACLVPGGLVVFELEHPGSIFDGVLTEGEQWETDGEDGSESLRVTYGTDMDDFNPVTQVHTRQVEISRKAGKGWELVGECLVEQRAFTVPEIELMAQLARLEVVWYYGSLDIKVDSLFHEDAYRMVVILRKAAD